MSLSPQFLDELRSRTLLSALVGRTLKITKAGREFKGCCPFHNEKTPSFYVNDEKGFYHCFGCSAHGDAIRWMTDQRGLGFMDAVKELADAAGMEVPAPDPRAAERAERGNALYDVMTAAQDWFVEQLQGIEGAEARSYLEKRGLFAKTIKDFGLGFAPDSKGKLKSALSRFGDDKLVEAGLLISVEDKDPYDRFRGRLMIPIRDPRGRVIAFGGRILGAGEPKYLNSPDTPLFDKGRTLYNLDKAGPFSRKSGRVIVVEGYMDVIALAQAGIEDVVAPLGTAVTEHQLERLWRYSNVPTLCLDGDAAGQKAAVRTGRRALPLLRPGYTVDFVSLVEGKDPADMVADGASAALQMLLANKRKPLSSVIWESELFQEPLATPEARAGLKERLFRLSDGIANPLVRNEYRSTFNSLFWETFGWGRKSVEATLRTTAALKISPLKAISDMTMRAVLLGLGRYPSVLREKLEQVAELNVENENLRKWRDVLVEACFLRPHLEESLIDTILAESDAWPIAPRDLTKDFAFSFFYSRESDDRPKRELREVISTLRAEQEIDFQLARANERVKAAVGNAEYEEQQRFLRDREEKRAQLRRFNDLMDETLVEDQRMTG